MKMESIESTNNYLLESSTTNDTITPLYNYKDLNQILDFLNSALIIFRTVLGIIAVIGLVGNILTVAVILRNKGIKSITDILVLTLAVTDILFIVFGGSMILLGYVRISTSPLEDEWCGLDYVTYTCNYASMYVLVLISLDRYLALVHPIRSMPIRTKQNCYILIATIWCIILLGNMPILFDNPLCSKGEEWNESYIRIFFIYVFVFEFMLPLLLMCILYGHILKLFHNAKIPGVNTSVSRVRLISNRRVIKMVIIALMVFMFCRLPFHIMSLYQAFVNVVENQVVFIILYMIVLCILYLNSCINPILYGSHSKTFRKGFRDVLRCKT